VTGRDVAAAGHGAQHDAAATGDGTHQDPAATGDGTHQGGRVDETERLRRWRLLLGAPAGPGLGAALGKDDQEAVGQGLPADRGPQRLSPAGRAVAG
jgi:hypothetical protein